MTYCKCHIHIYNQSSTNIHEYKKLCSLRPEISRKKFIASEENDL